MKWLFYIGGGWIWISLWTKLLFTEPIGDEKLDALMICFIMTLAVWIWICNKLKERI
jgi:hypothetical protein